MRLFVGANPVRVMASGAIDVNHKDEIYDGKVNFLGEISVYSSYIEIGYFWAATAVLLKAI